MDYELNAINYAKLCGKEPAQRHFWSITKRENDSWLVRTKGII